MTSRPEIKELEEDIRVAYRWGLDLINILASLGQHVTGNLAEIPQFRSREGRYLYTLLAEDYGMPIPTDEGPPHFDRLSLYIRELVKEDVLSRARTVIPRDRNAETPVDPLPILPIPLHPTPTSVLHIAPPLPTRPKYAAPASALLDDRLIQVYREGKLSPLYAHYEDVAREANKP